MRSELADEEDMRELIREFVLELPLRAAKMRGFADAQQHDALRAMAHQLKGAGGGYGYPRITQAAARLENAILTGTSESEVVEDLASLIEYCEAALAALPPDPVVVERS